MSLSVSASVAADNTLTAPLITACAALVGIVIGGWLTRVREHKRWLAEKRLESYAVFAEVATEGTERIFDPESDVDANVYAAKLLLQVEKINLIGSRRMFNRSLDLLRSYESLMGTNRPEPDAAREAFLKFSAQLADFLNAGRRDLSTDRRHSRIYRLVTKPIRKRRQMKAKNQAAG